MNIKRLLIASTSFAAILTSDLDASGQCESKVKDFYVTYMRNAEKNQNENVSHLEAHMSSGLIAKLKEYSLQYDADAVIHAQDVCEYGQESLEVLPMKKDWYLVRYKWSPNSEYTSIPVKATDHDGRLIILDISSEYLPDVQ